MGAFLKEMNLASGDLIEPEELDFVRTMLKGLESVFKYSYINVHDEKSRRKIALEDLSPAGISAYNEIKKVILAEARALYQLTLSPLSLGTTSHK